MFKKTHFTFHHYWGAFCPVPAVGKEMGVGRTQIMNILKRKREILDDFENNASSSISSTINVNQSTITTGTK